MRVGLWRRYELEVAHQLQGGLPVGHRCMRPHGHRYIVTLSLSGLTDEHGVLIEYADLDTGVWPVLKLLDHYSANTLNERCSTAQAEAVAANPTVERIALWIGHRLAGIVRSSKADGQRLRLDRVTVEEDSRSGAEWLPE